MKTNLMRPTVIQSVSQTVQSASQCNQLPGPDCGGEGSEREEAVPNKEKQPLQESGTDGDHMEVC